MAVEKDNIVPHLAQTLISDHSVLADLAAICILKLMSTKKYLVNALNTNLMQLALQMLKKHKKFSSQKNSLDLITHLLKKYKSFADKFKDVEDSFNIIVDTFENTTSKTIAFALLALVEWE